MPVQACCVSHWFTSLRPDLSVILNPQVWYNHKKTYFCYFSCWPSSLLESFGQCVKGPNSQLASSAAFRRSEPPPWTLHRTVHLDNKHRHTSWVQSLHCGLDMRFGCGKEIHSAGLTISIDVNLVKHHVGKVLSRHLTGNPIDCTDGLNMKHSQEVMFESGTYITLVITSVFIPLHISFLLHRNYSSSFNNFFVCMFVKIHFALRFNCFIVTHGRFILWPFWGW